MKIERIFRDTEDNTITTESKQLKIFATLKKEFPTEYDYTFEQYIKNCTSKNGFWEELKKETYGVYAPSWDITFVMEEITDKNGDPISTECVGWYYGEPSEEDNQTFKGKLIARYDWED